MDKANIEEWKERGIPFMLNVGTFCCSSVKIHIPIVGTGTFLI